RFELVVGLLLRQFSKLVVSATHPPLLTQLVDGYSRKSFAKVAYKNELCKHPTNYYTHFSLFSCAAGIVHIFRT
ncbi:MAG: hypothetical protein K2H14_04440, partial [Muribaculaceae bacterium]|nr:hypothetical protein [Muribaculaceae bacterium]